jgi:hypothetical protein
MINKLKIETFFTKTGRMILSFTLLILTSGLFTEYNFDNVELLYLSFLTVSLISLLYLFLKKKNDATLFSNKTISCIVVLIFIFNALLFYQVFQYLAFQFSDWFGDKYDKTFLIEKYKRSFYFKIFWDSPTFIELKLDMLTIFSFLVKIIIYLIFTTMILFYLISNNSKHNKLFGLLFWLSFIVLIIFSVLTFYDVLTGKISTGSSFVDYKYSFFKQNVFLLMVYYVYINIEEIKNKITEMKESFLILVVFTQILLSAQFLLYPIIKFNIFSFVIIFLLISLRDKIKMKKPNIGFSILFIFFILEITLYCIMNYDLENAQSKMENVVLISFGIIFFFYKDYIDKLILTYKKIKK